jgi:hypothetical protein
LAVEGESWDGTLQKDINAEDFVKFVLGSGYVSDEKGWGVLTDEFWKDYDEILNGILREKNEIILNGNKIENRILIQKDEILSATCFADKWNNRQYLVETKTKWAFFTWCTGA